MFPFKESNKHVPAFEMDDQIKKGALLKIVILGMKTFSHGRTTRFIIGVVMITVVILSTVPLERSPRWTMNKAFYGGPYEKTNITTHNIP